MATLETQYKNFLKDNPNSNLPFEEWKKVNARLIKQALINIIKDDEELGLYEEPKQETLYSEEEVIDIAKQAFVLGKDFGLIGTFKEWFDTVKKKS